MGVGLDLFNCFLVFVLFLVFFRHPGHNKRRVRKKKGGCVLLESSLSAAFTVFLYSCVKLSSPEPVPLTRTQARHLAAGHYLMFSAFPS